MSLRTGHERSVIRTWSGWSGVEPPDQKYRGPGPVAVLLAVPLLCCGAPLLLAGAGAVGAVTSGVAGVVVAVLAVVAGGLWWARRRRTGSRCCTAPSLGGTCDR